MAILRGSVSDWDRVQTGLEIVVRWGLHDHETQILFAVTPRMFYRWKAGRTRLGPDQRARISNLANIDIALEAVFNGGPSAIEWLRRPNASFGERSPLSLMLEDGFVGIARVRSSLERLL